MALIKTGASVSTPDTGEHIFSTAETENFAICKSPDKLKKLLDAITPGHTTYYLSDGHWSMHDLVMELIKKYQPADLYISTYALREFSAQQLILAIDRKEVNSVKMLLDYRAPVRVPAVVEMARMNFNKVFLVPCHAKITIIQSPAGSVTIVGSANWTSNPRIESGTISLNKELAAWYIEHFEKIMADGRIFE